MKPVSDTAWAKSPFVWVLVLLLVTKCLATYPLSLMPRFPDEGIYLTLGTSLAEGHGYTIGGRPTMIVVPGYPLLVGLCMAIFGSGSRLPLYVVQTVLTLVIALAYGSLITRWTGNRRLGHVGTVLIFVFPPYIQYSGTALTEILYSTWIALTCVAFSSVCRDPRAWANWLLLGLWHALGFMTRPVAFLLTPVLLLWPIIGHHVGWHKLVSRSAVSLVVMLSLWLPWVARNAQVSGQVVSFSTYSGVTLLAASLDDPATYADEYRRVLANAGFGFFDDEYRADRLLNQAASQRIQKNPLGYLGRVLSTNWHFWLWEYPQYFNLSVRFRDCVRDGRYLLLFFKLGLLGLNVLVPLGVVATPWLLRCRRDCWPYIGLVFYFWGMHAFLYPINRYSVPIVGLSIALLVTGVHSWDSSRLHRAAGPLSRVAGVSSC